MPPNQVRSQVVMSWEMSIVSTASHDTTIYQFRAIQSIANNNKLWNASKAKPYYWA